MWIPYRLAAGCYLLLVGISRADDAFESQTNDTTTDLLPSFPPGVIQVWYGIEENLTEHKMPPKKVKLLKNGTKKSDLQALERIYEDMNDSIATLESADGFASGVLSAFSMTAASEVGDKTFFIAAVLALSHSAVHVYAGAMSALILMTGLSAVLGMMFSILSAMWVQYFSALMFLVFGLKMLKEGCTMKKDAGREEMEEVRRSIENKMSGKNRSGSIQDVELGVIRTAAGWIIIEAFTMTFLSEWGDRSQVATVVLAAEHSVYGVILGAVLGHAACTLLAVVAGRLVADRISIRTVTLCGGITFLAFALGSLIRALDETFSES